MTELIITRGLPASGKTTWARRVVVTEIGWARLSRDEMREDYFNVYGIGTDQQEMAITDLMHRMCRAYLDNGINVIIDATNLRLRHAREYATIALEAGAMFTVKDFGTDVDTCVARDKRRDMPVGEAVIRDMAARFRDRPEVTPRVKAAEFPIEPYVPPVARPRAILVDIDGTLAHMDGRSPYEWERVAEDKVDGNLARIIGALNFHYHVIVMSGRDSKCRDVTQKWLDDNRIPHDALFMRPEGDNRPDTIIKYELFNEHIRENYNVECSFDDRSRVVALWRDLGIPCYQVAPGDF